MAALALLVVKRKFLKRYNFFTYSYMQERAGGYMAEQQVAGCRTGWWLDVKVTDGWMSQWLVAGFKTGWWLDIIVADYLKSEWLVYDCQMSGRLLAGRLCMVAGEWWIDVIVGKG